MKRLSRTSLKLSTKELEKGRDSELESTPASPTTMRDLQEFLVEAELSEYYLLLLTRLKVSTVEHLKYVKEEDLQDIGMTRPEMRRLKKFFKKECPQGAISKLKKAILKGGDGSSRTASPSSPTQRSPRPLSSGAPYLRPLGRQLIPIDSIQLGRTLGYGEFGVVQQGIWKTEFGETLQVAVKRLSRERMNTGTQNFLKEAAIMKDVDHEHIVRMFGVVLDTDDNMMLVTELAPMRSLLECLKDQSLRTDLPVTRLCDYALQVCDGMGYLESKRLVHRDLAARNILVFNKNQVKISDLGLSRMLEVGQDYYQSKFSTSLKLPIAWCAPECINFLKFTSASDVWSFAVMLWEFFTYGFHPWAGLNGQQILQAIDEPNSQRLEQPELCTNGLYKLMRECWAHHPDARPSFSDILIRLSQLKPTQVKTVKDYPSALPEKGYLYYKAGDVIVVINKSPGTSSLPGLVWKGVHVSGKCGLFDPTNVVPFIEPKVSSVTGHTISIVRKDSSSRKSGRKIRADMISQPQNDLRHTGHIGYDGAVFGDVSFIGDNYDKLPVKVGAGNSTSHDSLGRSLLPDRNGHIKSNISQNCSDSNHNGYGQLSFSQESHSSQSICQLEKDGRQSPSYLDIEDDSLFSDFKMPDLGSSFECGSSFMDEVLRALDEKEQNPFTDSSAATGTFHSLEPNIRTLTRTQPPVPAPRGETRPSSSLLVVPAQSPRVEHPKEKKQTKVKPMSASEEKMVDTAMARVRELTSHMIGGPTYSPPVSPLQDKGSSFFSEETGILSRLKNSIKRSGSPRNERKRTFSEELEHKGDFDEVTPEAQQAYNMLVVKGSFKEKSSSSSKQHSVTQDCGYKDNVESRKVGNVTQSKDCHELELSDWSRSDLVRDSIASSNLTTISAPAVVSSSQPIPIIAGPHLFPQISTSPSNKHVASSLAKSTPNSAPRSRKTENVKKSEISTSLPHQMIPKVEPTIWHVGPASPEIPPKSGKRNKSPISDPDFTEVKPKKTTEILQLDDSLNRCNNTWDSFQHSPSYTLSTDHTSENSKSEVVDWTHRSKHDQETYPKTVSSIVECNDSFSKKQASSIFEEDLKTPSPQEIMNKLRERRLNQHLDQQRTLAAENEASSVATTSTSQLSAREQNIPGRTSNILTADGGEGSNQEVDTNPLRMLRGGAIPIRITGKGSTGTGNHGSSRAAALRVPQLNFSRHFSRSITDQQRTDLILRGEATASSIQEKDSASSTSALDVGDNSCAAAEMTREVEESTNSPTELTREMEESTNSPTELNYLELLTSDSETKDDNETTKKSDSCLSQDLQLDLTMFFPPTTTSSIPSHSIASSSSSKETSTDSDGSSTISKIPVKSNGETLAPPRLPPRRSQSLNENSEKCQSHLSVLPISLRRSNSFEESNDSEAPALPPRKPHAGRTPLNARPRERKFPLQIHLPSQDKLSPRQMNTESPTPKHHTSHLKSPTMPSPPISLTASHSHSQPISSATSSRQHQSLAVHSPNSPVCRRSPRHPALNNAFMSQSLDSTSASHHLHHHHSNSIDLPPSYDLSVNHSISSSSDVADCEPTHMLLDLHTPHLPLPLSVNLPPSSDLSVIDEPTHVSLSSLTDNKHSWSATFTSPSPLSPSFSRRQHIISHSSQGNASPTINRAFDRSLSTDTRIRIPGLYPSYSDNQSPPADLPPAPPTPSYREKLGFEQQKPKVMRSVSHTPNTQRCPSNLLAVDSASFPTSYRGRSASTHLPVSHSHHIDSSLTSPASSPSPQVFHFPHSSYEIDDGDDQAFFAEAPSYPHPYSQSPFHPLVPSSPNDLPQSSSIYSSISLLQTTPNISPYQVSTAISRPNQVSNNSSPLTVSRLDLDPPPMFRRSLESSSTHSHTHTGKHMCAPQPLSPKSNSTHTYNTVSLPASQTTPLSSCSSRSTLNNCLVTSANSSSQNPGELQSIDTSKQKLDLPHSSRAFRVFKFPNPVCTDTIPPTSLSNSAAAPTSTHPISDQDLSPTVDYPSSSEVSPLMFASYNATSSVSYEDLRQFALDRHKNCEEIETLLKIFADQVTIEECMTALESTQWDVTKATKYLQLKKLLSLGVADVYKCKEALSASGWNLQCAAEALLESSRAPGVSSSVRGLPGKTGILTSHNRPTTPEIVDV